MLFSYLLLTLVSAHGIASRNRADPLSDVLTSLLCELGTDLGLRELAAGVELCIGGQVVSGSSLPTPPLL